jgi:hypothetical protein
MRPKPRRGPGRLAELKLLLVPAQINQVLLERQAIGPAAARPHRLYVFGAGGDNSHGA